MSVRLPVLALLAQTAIATFTILSFISRGALNNQSRESMARRRRCRRQRKFSFAPILAALQVLCIGRPQATQAHLLTGYEMAIGRWELAWRRAFFDRRDFVDEVIFPLTSPSKVDAPGVSNETILFNEDSSHVPTCTSKHKLKRQRRKWRQKRRRRSLKCSLDIKSDGTFTLEPIQTERDDDMRHQIRGEWMLQPNPYCVTDRHFESVVFLSYPRVKRIKEWDKQFAMLEMRCQLWGRFGMKSIRDFVGQRHGRSAGRLVRGSVMLVRREQHGDVDLRKSRYFIPRWRRKIIVAQFSAHPVSSGDAADSDLYEACDDVDNDDWASFDEEEEPEQI